jgi:hypothetical protein
LGLSPNERYTIVTQGKNKVLIEFHMDDTGSAAEKDTLVDISFFMPNTNSVYEAIKDEGVEKTSAQVRCHASRILNAHLLLDPDHHFTTMQA